MKKIKKIINYISIVGIGIMLFSCNDYLDVTPESDVSSADYLWSEDQLEAYITACYLPQSTSTKTSEANYSSTNVDFGGRLPSHYGSGGESFLNDDLSSDNSVTRSGNSRFIKNSWTTGSDGGYWNFTNISILNYYLTTVVPRYETGEIEGVEDNIKHYIGEGYFFRALEYFYRLRKLGDFPIVTEVLDDDQESLTEASKRSPRTDVARFIISDLDKAIDLLLDEGPSGGKTRITKYAALLLKSRVALYEASWDTYFAGTAFVPNGEGWPGADKDYLSDYQFESGSLQGEVQYFLEQAMDAAQQVADNFSLTTNNDIVVSAGDEVTNPYYDMFACTDPGDYDEVILWRQYVTDVKSHSYNHWNYGGGNKGYTHQFEQTFLMQNGLPVYADGSGYAGDDLIADTKTNRDYRWQLFMKSPGDVKCTEDVSDFEYFPSVPYVHISAGTSENGTSTGYIRGKGYSYNDGMHVLGYDITAAVIFRAAEAYLNYIEADYMLNGSISSTSDTYWRALRTRAGVDEDYTKTIAATDMSKEGENDWGAYSAGTLVDATLYNIRRERRCEFIGEGLRYMDLHRWRAMDQLESYQLEGCKIWGSEMQAEYTAAGINLSNYVGSTISSSDLSEYQRPLQAVVSNNSYYNGYTHYMAHYLDPIANSHFLETADDGVTVSSSPIYQNPYWSTAAGESPEYDK